LFKLLLVITPTTAKNGEKQAAVEKNNIFEIFL
jgi:hypothetical protein